MLCALWSPKGGSGTTTVTAACALAAARGDGARLADLAGDQAAMLGLASDPPTGLFDWLAAGPDAPTEALERLAVDASPRLMLLSPGSSDVLSGAPASAVAGAALGVALRDSPVPTFVDLGTASTPAAQAVLEVSDVVLMVVRGCYLTLRRAVAAPGLVATHGILLVDEGRSLGAREVSDVLGRPVLARFPVRAAIARAIDAGVIASRLPEQLARPAREVLRAIGINAGQRPGGCGSVNGTATMARESPTDSEIKAVVHRQLLAAAAEPEEIGSPFDARIRERLGALLADAAPLLRSSRRVRLVDELVAEVTGLGPLEPHLADPDVTELMINGPGRAYVERNGRIESIALDLDADGIRRLVERVIRPLGLRLDRASPIVDARLADGSRLHAAIPPLAVDGPCVTIRRFACRRVSLASFRVGAIGEAFLRDAVAGGWNLVVAGGTSAGKTTFLNALSTAIPGDERIITVEETAELQLERKHVVRLEARPANAEGAGGVTVRDLVRTALRMRPDRIVVGEVRGGEAFDMLQALNTGHDGSLTTVHANGVLEALHRLETLVLLAGVDLPIAAVRAQLATSVDAVVHVARSRAGTRVVTAVAEVVPAGAPDGQLEVRTLFRAGVDGLEPGAEPERPFRRGIQYQPASEGIGC